MRQLQFRIGSPRNRVYINPLTQFYSVDTLLQDHVTQIRAVTPGPLVSSYLLLTTSKLKIMFILITCVSAQLVKSLITLLEAVSLKMSHSFVIAIKVLQIACG